MAIQARNRTPVGRAAALLALAVALAVAGCGEQPAAAPSMQKITVAFTEQPQCA